MPCTTTHPREFRIKFQGAGFLTAGTWETFLWETPRQPTRCRSLVSFLGLQTLHPKPQHLCTPYASAWTSEAVRQMSPPEGRGARPWLTWLACLSRATRAPATRRAEAARPPGECKGVSVGGVSVWGGQGLVVVFARTPRARVSDQGWEISGLFGGCLRGGAQVHSVKRLRCGAKQLRESVTNVALCLSSCCGGDRRQQAGAFSRCGIEWEEEGGPHLLEARDDGSDVAPHRLPRRRHLLRIWD